MGSIELFTAQYFMYQVSFCKVKCITLDWLLKKCLSKGLLTIKNLKVVIVDSDY